MSDKPEMIEVKLVPVSEEDEQALHDAIGYLEAFRRLAAPRVDDDWAGVETIDGLRRLGGRIRGYGVKYEIPMPTALGDRVLPTGTPLFTGVQEVT